MTRRVERILFVGVGDHWASEAAALEGAAGAEQVTVVRPGQGPPGRGFVDALELELGPRRAALARDLLDRAEDDGVVAGLLLAYRDAERGGPPLERVVVSGHCGGTGVYGEETGAVLAFDDLVALAELFPRAAAQVEDVMFSACHSGWEGKLEAYHLQAFPALKTMWAYVDKSPLGGGAAEAHMRVWERRSRDDAFARVDRRRFAGEVELPREENIATWNVKTGYASTRQAPLRELLGAAYAAEGMLGDPSLPPRDLRACYDALQALAGHRRFGELAAEERAIHLGHLDDARARLGIR